MPPSYRRQGRLRAYPSNDLRNTRQISCYYMPAGSHLPIGYRIVFFGTHHCFSAGPPLKVTGESHNLMPSSHARYGRIDKEMVFLAGYDLGQHIAVLTHQ